MLLFCFHLLISICQSNQAGAQGNRPRPGQRGQRLDLNDFLGLLATPTFEFESSKQVRCQAAGIQKTCDTPWSGECLALAERDLFWSILGAKNVNRLICTLDRPLGNSGIVLAGTEVIAEFL